MKPTTRLASQRRAARQTLKGALQRLTMTLMLVMLTSMSAWADESGLFDVNRFSWEYVTATQTLTIQHVSGSTDMTDFEYSGIRKWDSYKNNIQHLVIGSGITYIGKYAFKNLPALQDVTFEAGSALESIGQYAFNNCPSLTSVTLPSSLRTIGDWAFNACTGLTSVTLPEGLTFIGQKAFYATALTSLTIPASVTTIRYEAFRHCNSLEMVIMNVADPSTLTLESAFPLYMTVHVNDVAAWEAQFPYATYFCVFEDMPTNIWECGNTHVKLFVDGTVRVSKKVGTDGVMANYTSGSRCPWYDNRNDIQKVIVKSGVLGIGKNAFYQCSNLTSVTLHEGVSSIGDHAFRECSNLTSVKLPEGLTSIGDFAFRYCTSLASVTIYAPSLTEYGVNAFTNNATGRKIYVFSDCVNTYKSQNNWQEYTTVIVPITLTANDAGGELGRWCTYYNGLADVTMPEGTTVYKAALNGAKTGVVLTETGSRIVKRGEAVLLNTTSGSLQLSSAADGGSGDYSGNELKGVDVETPQDANTTYYVLSKVNDVFGFYKLARENGKSEPIKLGANKAYLAVAIPPTSAPAYLGFDVDGETTGINEHEFNDCNATLSKRESHELSGAIYDLQGRRIANGQKPSQRHTLKERIAKGLYIVNGKKVVIK